MSPDDPRHGTEAGYLMHRRDGEGFCGPCTHARMVAAKRRRLYGSRKVSTLGSQRRIQALQALGWSRDIIAREMGYADHGSLTYLMNAATMLPETAEKIAAVYERLCMVVATGPGANRARSWARRFGYAPPLAWDNIDDPDEQPTDWQYRPADRADAIRDLIDRGASISDACRRLGLRRDSLEKWCERNGMTDELLTLNRREHGGDRWGVFGGAA